MKQVSTLFLKGVIFLIAITVLALCVFGLPWIVGEISDHFPRLVFLPVVIGMYVTAIPFFIAIYQALKLLGYIDKNKAFSELSIKTLRTIKYCAIIISILYIAGTPFSYIMAQIDDAPGIIIPGLVVILASIAVATLAAILEKLLQNALDIKKENDLTV